MLASNYSSSIVTIEFLKKINKNQIPKNESLFVG